MIVIGDTSSMHRLDDMPSEVTAQELLVACAAAMRSQAEGMGKMDVALGRVLEHLRAQTVSTRVGSPIFTDLLGDLQRADRLRQEAEGLAKVLELVVGFGTVEGLVPTDALRTCTPLAELQERLLASCRSTINPE